MTSTVMSFKKISGADIKVNHRTYKAPEGMSIIYLHKCTNPETGEVFNYVGSTDISIAKRSGKLFANYLYGPETNSKFSNFLRTYGCYMIKSKILYVVDNELRAQVEQEEIEKYNALGLGFNTCRAVKEFMNPPKNYSKDTKASAKNNPTEISVENLQLTMKHRCEPTDYVIMNKGFYLHYFKDTVLGLHTPGMKGHISIPKNAEGIRSALRYLERDLGVNLRYGPDGCHVFTLDNIYLVGRKISLRTFLDLNPIYIKKVSYLTFGEWDTEERLETAS
jgi:hypothetical protein